MQSNSKFLTPILAVIKDKGLDIIVENCPVGALTFKDAPVSTLSPKFKR